MTMMIINLVIIIIIISNSFPILCTFIQNNYQHQSVMSNVDDFINIWRCFRNNNNNNNNSSKVMLVP